MQLISDIHLDARPQQYDAWMRDLPKFHPNQKKITDTLILAGDVAPCVNKKYRDYLSAVSEGYRHVVYVPGNHEFYDSSLPIPESTDYIERVCASLPSKFYVLRSGGSHFDVEDTDIRVIGATMWTNVPDYMWPSAEFKINDYNYIMGRNGRKVTTDEINEMHSLDKRWLAVSANEAKRQGKQVVVVTHHCPDRRLSLYNDFRTVDGIGPLYFASDMGSVMGIQNIVAWCHGHTHESYNIHIKGYKYPFITNAFGYPGENTGFAFGAGLGI
jgi:3',5'-cyclic AMP phosphodiesterase CpdA